MNLVRLIKKTFDGNVKIIEKEFEEADVELSGE